MNPELVEIKHDLSEIKKMLSELMHPAQSMDIHAKSKAILDALQTGDRKHYRNVLKQINGEQ